MKMSKNCLVCEQNQTFVDDFCSINLHLMIGFSYCNDWLMLKSRFCSTSRVNEIVTHDTAVVRLGAAPANHIQPCGEFEHNFR